MMHFGDPRLPARFWKRAELIEEIERQLQTKTSIEPVFTLRWTLGGRAGTTA